MVRIYEIFLILRTLVALVGDAPVTDFHEMLRLCALGTRIKK